jgi:uncharacterized protein (TIGR03790 family)
MDTLLLIHNFSMRTCPLQPLSAVSVLLFISFILGFPAQPVLAENESIPAWSSREIAVIVNDRDKLSVEIGAYYQAKRKIPPDQVIHIRFNPQENSLSEAQFKLLKHQVDNKTPAHVQGYVLTWLLPFRVDCLSITTAFAAGYDKAFCAKGCKETRHNPYFNSISSRPFTDFGWRPAMVLAGKNFAEVKDLIDRGVAADFSNPKGSAYLLKTTDTARSSRAVQFPDVAKRFNPMFPSNYLEANFIENRNDVMFYFTGLTHVQRIKDNQFLPGAIADHLTSSGGILNGSDQMSILEWLQAGVTGSYGAVVEPCNFPEKFSNPAMLMDYYLRGNTLIEAYWKSVAEPGQGIFVGEPLAKPFAKITQVSTRAEKNKPR